MRRKYRGKPVAPSAEEAPDAFRESMREQFGNARENTHGGAREGAGRPPKDSSLKIAKKQGLLPDSVEILTQLTTVYPDLAAYAEILLEEHRIIEFQRILMTRPSATHTPRAACERYGRAMGLGYDRALPLFREAQARLESGTVAQSQEQIRRMAQHLLTLANELVRRECGSAESLRTYMDAMKFAGNLAGLGGSKLTLELPKAQGEPAPPIGDPRRRAWLEGMVARLDATATAARAELEQERDAAALEAPGARQERDAAALPAAGEEINPPKG